MALPYPPINPNYPIPNNPFYYPESWYLQGPGSPLVVGSGLSVSPSGVISSSGGGGGGGVSSIVTGPGLLASATTGNILLVNTGILDIVPSTGIALSTVDGVTTIASTNTGTVSLVNTGAGLSGGPISSVGTIALTNTGVTPGVYSYPQLQVDAQGRILNIASQSAVQCALGVAPIQVSAGPTPAISVDYATNCLPGVVLITDSISSTCSNVAATAKAVNCVFTIANAAIPCSCFVGKGSLLTSTVTSVPVALPVGGNGLVLTADSTQSTGLVWAVPGSIPQKSIVSIQTDVEYPFIRSDSPIAIAWTDYVFSPVNASSSATVITLDCPGLYDINVSIPFLRTAPSNSSTNEAIIQVFCNGSDIFRFSNAILRNTDATGYQCQSLFGSGVVQLTGSSNLEFCVYTSCNINGCYYSIIQCFPGYTASLSITPVFYG